MCEKFKFDEGTVDAIKVGIAIVAFFALVAILVIASGVNGTGGVVDWPWNP